VPIGVRCDDLGNAVRPARRKRNRQLDLELLQRLLLLQEEIAVARRHAEDGRPRPLVHNHDLRGRCDARFREPGLNVGVGHRLRIRSERTDVGRWRILPQLPIPGVMAAPRESAHRVRGAARTGAAGTVVAAFAFFDGVFIGAPIAIMAVALRPLPVFVGACFAVSLLSVGCCRWLDRRWDEWLLGHGTKIEHRLERMRASRLMQHPVAWIQSSSDRRYAVAAAVVNPILVLALARSVGGTPIGRRRILLGSIAYAIPYVAMWTVVGIALSRV